MIVSKDKVVLMHYTLKNDKGEVIDSSEGKDPLAFLQGHGNIIPGLEKALEGSKLGDKKEVSIEPEEAYGPLMKDAIQEIPSSALKGIEEVTVGMQLQSQDQDGNPFVVTVVKIEDDKLRLTPTILWPVRRFIFLSVSKRLEMPIKKSSLMAMFTHLVVTHIKLKKLIPD